MSDSTLLTGTQVTLTCDTTSQGHATYKFWNNGQVIPGSGPGATYIVPSTSGRKSITCTAEINGVESAPSYNITLKFVGKIFIYFVGFLCIW